MQHNDRRLEKKVFVDGQYGTTGLKIHERLNGRRDIELLDISIEKKKDPNEKRDILNQADIVFLCLPDDAARESVSLIESPAVCIIDGSTAHRTSKGWTYGLPELHKNQRQLIRDSRRISVPGCHATGFNLLVYPLVHEGVVHRDALISCYSVTGYSGGGKPLIAQYEAPVIKESLRSPRLYSLSLQHKHLPEMQKVSGLTSPPVFTPVVSNFYRGEVVSVPLHTRVLAGKFSASDIHRIFEAYYADELFVTVLPYPADDWLDDGCLGPAGCNHTNRLEIFVFGNQEHVLLSARFDNLGKGSSGAAIQNMNLLIGAPEDSGL